MEFFSVVLGIAVLIAVGWVFQKIGGFALVGVNRGLFFRGEYKAGKHLREGLTIHTSVPVSAVMRELDTYVCAVDAPLGFSEVLYNESRTDTGIAWAFGSASKVKLEAVLAFSPAETGTDAIFAVTRWFEEDGLLASADALKTLRLQVAAAFRAADPAVTITEGHADRSELSRFDGVFESAE